VTVDKRTIELWPEGRPVTYSGDYPNYTIHQGESVPNVSHRIRVEELARRIMDEDLLACQSILVDVLMRQDGSDDVATAFAWDNVTNLTPDASAWGVEKCVEWLSERMTREEIVELVGFDPKPRDVEEARKVLAEHGLDLDYEEDAIGTLVAELEVGRRVPGLDSLREKVADMAEPEEVYEWWLVSRQLARSLVQVGECVLYNDYGCWWGRTCTGQAILMDGVMQRVAEFILAIH
jgi:hypothetical protein